MWSTRRLSNITYYRSQLTKIKKVIIFLRRKQFFLLFDSFRNFLLIALTCILRKTTMTSYSTMFKTYSFLFLLEIADGVRIRISSSFTVTVFQETSYYRMYRLVGWGYPVLMTLTWAVVTAFYFHPSKWVKAVRSFGLFSFLFPLFLSCHVHRCWWGYNLTLYFWILEGPRVAVILVSLTPV